MSARFQRLDNSEDITTSPEITYSSKYYDEPESLSSTSDRRRSSTLRKPVSNGSQPKPQPQSPIQQAQSPVRIQSPVLVQSPTQAQAPYQPQPYQPQPYQPQTYQPQPYNPQQYQPQTQFYAHPQPRTASQSTTPEQPLMDNYFHGTPQFVNTPRQGSVNDYNASLRSSKKDSIITRAKSAVFAATRTQHVSHVATPLWAAPWRHEPCADLGGARNSTVRFFDRVKQRNRIFFHFFLQWLVPVVFCVLLFTTLYVFGAKPKISRKEKYIFNALVLGFSLCLGFAVLDGLKGYAGILRWRLLARRYRSLQEFELLLGLASQKKALRLLWVGRTEGSILPNGTQLLCFCYLLLMFGMQLGIALLGLCYSVDVAIFEHLIVPNGNVSIVDLSYFQQADVVSSNVAPFRLQSGVINSYGVTGQRFSYSVQSNTSLARVNYGDYSRLATDNSTMWWYRFIDQCPEPECTADYVTDRRVTSEAKCQEYTITSGGYYDNKTIGFIDQNGVRQTFAYMNVETSATTTWYANTAESCGDRCTTIYVMNTGYESKPTRELWRPQFFQCNNTISKVLNSDHLQDSDTYQLPDEQARLVAGAIGWNGVTWGVNNTFQARTYDAASLWSWTRMNGAHMQASDVANLIMHFSTGALAALDFLGDRVFVTGDSPIPAQEVSIHWNFAIIILAVIPLVQFAVLMVAVVWGNHAIIRDDSFLSVAALLRPIVEQLERTGCALTADEICEVLGNPSIAYGVRMPQSSVSYGSMTKGHEEVMHLDIIAQQEESNAPAMSWRTGMKMPQGRYDGVKIEEAETTAREADAVMKQRKM